MPTFRTSVELKTTPFGLPHLILVGLPGSGKTTVGRAVAEKLGRPFLDFDEEIVRRETMSITEIFGAKGEQHFRQLEKKLTEELTQTSGMVVSPGGGWVSNPEVVAIIRPFAKLVYIRVQPATALKRLGSDQATRPLLMRADPLSELKKLLDQRKAVYETADATVSAELLSLQGVIDAVAELGAMR